MGSRQQVRARFQRRLIVILTRVLVCLSAHQRTTSLEDLERLSVIGDAAATELTAAHDAIRGAVVLATALRRL